MPVQFLFIIKLWKQVDYEKVKKVIKAFDLPTKLPKGLNLKKLYKTMTLDKKVKNNQMVYVIPKNIGKAYITNKIHKNIVMKALEEHV